MTGYETNVGEAVVFWVCAVLSVLGAVGLVTSRKAVHSALWMALTMINLAILYIANNAPFLGMVQIIVYTGAVMMLFLFVLMVVGVDSSDSLIETIRAQRFLSMLLGLLLIVILVWGLGSALSGLPSVGLDAANRVDGGNVQGIAHLIFTDYLLVFEVTSALLITAAMGAMVLAHREHWLPKLTQAQLSIARFKSEEHPGNRPSPGIYARHNAVDTPALLPDGTPTEASIPGALRSRADVQPVEIEDGRAIQEGDSK